MSIVNELRLSLTDFMPKVGRQVEIKSGDAVLISISTRLSDELRR